MIVVKRHKGAFISAMVAVAGKVTVAPTLAAASAIENPPPPIPVKRPRGRPRKDGLPAGSVPKETKAIKEGKESTYRSPQAPRDASDGHKLAFKLHHAILACEAGHLTEADRNDICYKLGKTANEIGPGDPDVAAALEKARKDQGSYRVESGEIDLTGRECVEGSSAAWGSWSAAFIGGYVAKSNTKGTPTIKRYLLTVTIAGIDPQPGHKSLDAIETEIKEARFEEFGDALRAAIRWYTLKSDIAHRMSVVIDTLDLANSLPREEPIKIPALTYPVSLAEARVAAAAADRRQNRGSVMHVSKGKQNLRISLPTCHESRASFSQG